MREQVELLKLFLEIDEAIRRIERRFNGIKEPDDFIRDDDGLDRLDGINMMLIAISENICRIDKIIGKGTFNKYPDVNWGEVKGIRNILAHAYFDADHEEVYTICAFELECLKQTLAKIRSDI
ncbi:MAG: DUF86 domain-containing protein [Pseudanabaena sp.]